MYLYSDLKKDCCKFCKLGVTCGSIGRSVGGKHLIFFHVGALNGKQIIIQGGIHGREWVTSFLIIKQLAALVEKRLPVGIYFVPMSNPDGCELAQLGASAYPKRRAALTEMNKSDDFCMWKANLRGVDINCNFDAKWGTGAGNVFTPSPSSNAGPRATSEPETKALVNFTDWVKPALTVSYHALGREVYYEFGQTDERLERDRYIAHKTAEFLDYRLVHGDLESAGGYKDWCIAKRGIPSLTIEIIGEEHLHPLSEKDLIGEEKNIWLPKLLAQLVQSI